MANTRGDSTPYRKLMWFAAACMVVYAAASLGWVAVHGAQPTQAGAQAAQAQLSPPQYLNPNSVYGTPYPGGNLTGIWVGAATASAPGRMFVTVNKVEGVSVRLNASAAYPGQPVEANVTYYGVFGWNTNETSAYLSSPIANYHYFGVMSAATGWHLLDQNNGPWYELVSQHGQPPTITPSNATSRFSIGWTITPAPSQVGNTIYLCGGYFAALDDIVPNVTVAYDDLSYMREDAVTNSVINIVSSNCSALTVLPPP